MSKSKSRKQLIASIVELTPQEMGACLKLEEHLKKLSNWKTRDAIKEFCDVMQSAAPATIEHMEDKEFLHVAWEVIDFVNESRKLLKALPDIFKGEV